MADSIENIPSREDYSPNIDAPVNLTPAVKLNMIRAYVTKQYGKENSIDKIRSRRELEALPDAELKTVLGIKDIGNTKKKMSPEQVSAISTMLTMPDAFEALKVTYNQARDADPAIFGGAIRGLGTKILASGPTKVMSAPEITKFKTARRILFNPVARGLGGEKGPLSNFDVQAWEDGIPSERDSPEEMEVRLQALRSQAQNVVQTNLDGLEAAGYDVGKFKNLAQQKGLYGTQAPQPQAP